jgi:hypothetical protein
VAAEEDVSDLQYHLSHKLARWQFAEPRVVRCFDLKNGETSSTTFLKSREKPGPHSLFRLGIFLTLSIFVSKALIMVGISFLTFVSPWIRVILYPSILLLFLLPVLYFFIFRLMALQLNKEKKESKIIFDNRRLHDMLGYDAGDERSGSGGATSGKDPGNKSPYTCPAIRTMASSTIVFWAKMATFSRNSLRGKAWQEKCDRCWMMKKSN